MSNIVNIMIEIESNYLTYLYFPLGISWSSL
jgi:hypothetical protein